MCGTASDLQEAQERAKKSQDSFTKVIHGMLPHIAPAMPEEAREVDRITGNRTDALQSAVAKSLMMAGMMQEMINRAVEQAKEDEEMAEEARRDLELLQESKKKKKDDKPGKQAEGSAHLRSLTIEKRAKLDASICRLRAQLRAPQLALEHLTESEQVKERAEGQRLFDKASETLEK